jgi:hypothetical protein
MPSIEELVCMKKAPDTDPSTAVSRIREWLSCFLWVGRRTSNVDQVVKSILSRELDDGHAKLSDEYWCSDRHNVGNDVIAAVSAAIISIRELTGTYKAVRLEVAISELRVAAREYSENHADRDGFGAGTLVEIMRLLSEVVTSTPDSYITAAAVRGL